VRLVRGRADARRLPSRHNFALFRLAAFLRMRRAQPEPRNVVLVLDRHQSTFETWLVLSWVMLTVSCYCAVTLFRHWHITLALAVSLPLVFMLLHVVVIVTGLTLARVSRDGIRANSVILMFLITAASAYFSTRPGWIRFVGWQFLAMLALNALAAMIVFALSDSITRLEARVGGDSSAS
jgi:hypothetical protein